MRGLMEKDIRIILSRRSNVVIFLFLGGLITWQSKNTMGLIYMTMLGALLALGTISYDDADNCMAFLMTLPCTRKEYVIEKYFFIAAVSLSSWGIGSVIYIICCVISGAAITRGVLLDMVISVAPILLFTCALMIPLQLKYGAERSRVVLLVIIGACAACVFAISSAGDSWTTLVDRMVHLNGKALAPLFLIAGIILVIISAMISVRIMEKKEF